MRGTCAGWNKKWILLAGPGRATWVVRSSKNLDARVGGLKRYGSEEIRRNGAASSQAEKEDQEDGWESHVEDWGAGKGGARQSKGEPLKLGVQVFDGWLPVQHRGLWASC